MGVPHLKKKKIRRASGPVLIQFHYIYSQLSRSFTARGVTSRDPPKGIRLISFLIEQNIIQDSNYCFNSLAIRLPS